MLDPDSTNVLQRRVLASLVDLGLIAVSTALIWRTQWIRFEISARDPITNDMIPNADQAARINEIAASLHTSFEWRGSLVVLDQTGLVLTALFGLVMALVTFVLLPANTGWSPGKRLLGLSVVDREGKLPSLSAHLARSVAGLLDAIPFVVPGLLGWMLARNDDFHRRIGDRIAKTHVIDAKAGVRFIDPGVYARRNELRRRVVEPDTDGNAMVPIEDRLAIPAATTDPAQLEPPAEVGFVEGPLPAASSGPSGVFDLDVPVDTVMAPVEPTVPPSPMIDAGAPARQGSPLFAISELGPPDPAGERPVIKVPRPSHRGQEPDPGPTTTASAEPSVGARPVASTPGPETRSVFDAAPRQLDPRQLDPRQLDPRQLDPRPRRTRPIRIPRRRTPPTRSPPDRRSVRRRLGTSDSRTRPGLVTRTSTHPPGAGRA